MKKILLSLLLTQSAFSNPIDNDLIGGCNPDILKTINGITNLIPAFSPTVFNCDSNTFLPANAIACQTCPDGYTCIGGNLTFNKTNAGGINIKPISTSSRYTCSENFLHANNKVANLIPIFSPNIHTCLPGYYLPANVDFCTICPKDNYCVGGTYSFNETDNQGINACPEYKYSDVGTSLASQCIGHKLHIDDNIIYLKPNKLTIPSLNILLEDRVWFANMTTTPTPMNNATEHYLKIEYDGVIYYVCDDTTYGE